MQSVCGAVSPTDQQLRVKPAIIRHSPLLSSAFTETDIGKRISRRSYFVNSRRFTEFLDRYFHIPLSIVTKHELGLPFPIGNLCINFGANPSTIFLVIVVKDTHKPTPVKTYSLAFREDNNKVVGMTLTESFSSYLLFTC